eukprot:COSAG06_NODE_2820_length_6233_cov_12.699463_4_plen_514_part_00
MPRARARVSPWRHLAPTLATLARSWCRGLLGWRRARMNVYQPLAGEAEELLQRAHQEVARLEREVAQLERETTDGPSQRSAAAGADTSSGGTSSGGSSRRRDDREMHLSKLHTSDSVMLGDRTGIELEFSESALTNSQSSPKDDASSNHSARETASVGTSEGQGSGQQLQEQELPDSIPHSDGRQRSVCSTVELCHLCSRRGKQLKEDRWGADLRDLHGRYLKRRALSALRTAREQRLRASGVSPWCIAGKCGEKCWVAPPKIIELAGRGAHEDLDKLLNDNSTACINPDGPSYSRVPTASRPGFKTRSLSIADHTRSSAVLDNLPPILDIVPHEFLETQLPCGRTALIEATRSTQLRCVELLLTVGADPFSTDGRGRSAWYFGCFGVGACVFGKGNDLHDDLIKLLVRFGFRHLLENSANGAASEAMLCACYSNEDNVTWTVLDALRCEILTKDSRGNCTFKFRDLHLLDNPTTVLRWPDNTTTKLGDSAFDFLAFSGRYDVVVHPALRYQI